MFDDPGVIPDELKKADPELAAQCEAEAEKDKDFKENVHSFGEVKDNLPPLKPEIIQGLLRQGHKMIFSAPSKSGKSFALINLAIAFAEGNRWLDFECKKCRVIYLNMEIDKASFRHRVAHVYERLGWPQIFSNDFFIKDLRGKHLSCNDLKTYIISWAEKCEAEVIIIDPIYKIGVRDENSAGDVGTLCTFFDEIAEETGASIIYSHHYAKGNSAEKEAIDRASGSGVFVRDADAIITMTPLQEEDCYRVEFVLREFSNPSHIGVKRDGILLIRDSSLDDAPLKGKGKSAEKQQEEKKEAKERERQEALARIVEIVKAKSEKDGGYKKTDLTNAIYAQMNISRNKAAGYVQVLIADGRLIEKKGPNNNTKIITIPSK